MPVENPEFSPGDMLRLWKQAGQELRGLAKHMDTQHQYLTAAQLRMAIEMADIQFQALTNPPLPTKQQVVAWLRANGRNALAIAVAEDKTFGG